MLLSLMLLLLFTVFDTLTVAVIDVVATAVTDVAAALIDNVALLPDSSLRTAASTSRTT